MKYLFLLLFLFALNTIKAQTKGYNYFIQQADSLYKIKQYRSSASTFSDAFKLNGGKGRLDHRINAARSWVLARIPDSAYFNLERVVATGHYKDYDQLNTEPAFKSLHQENRWQTLIAKVKALKEQSGINLNRPLASILDTIYETDQLWRLKMDTIIKQYGFNSSQVQKNAQSMHESDSANLIKVKSILDKHGWLGSDIVGEKGNTALFLVIQHADIESQSHYLPMLQQAVKNGKARVSDLALLEDRIALRKGVLQKYGSQIGKSNSTGRAYVLKIQIT
jgi:hypothetical protein